MTYDIIYDGDEIIVYKIRRSRSHHKGGFKSSGGERIPLEEIPKQTLLRLTRKGLHKEVLP